MVESARESTLQIPNLFEMFTGMFVMWLLFLVSGSTVGTATDVCEGHTCMLQKQFTKEEMVAPEQAPDQCESPIRTLRQCEAEASRRGFVWRGPTRFEDKIPGCILRERKNGRTTVHFNRKGDPSATHRKWQHLCFAEPTRGGKGRMAVEEEEESSSASLLQGFIRPSLRRMR